MSRWTIEKNGTGIEKSGTGVERSGTGIEKSGTGIEKSGTGIEKSGTGIRRFVFACAIAFVSFASNLQAGTLDPSGSIQLVVDRGTVGVSWIIDGSVFSGIGSLDSSYASIQLTEISLTNDISTVKVTGSGSGKQVTGSGSGTEVTGSGSGSSKLVTGSGSGSSLQVTGSGSGSSALVTGSGSGFSVQVTGTGSGSSTLVTGSGSGSSTLVTGTGSGGSVEVTGSGSGFTEQRIIAEAGNDNIAVTLPFGTGLAMNISLGCRSATVTVLDANFASVATFNNVNVVGNTGLCGGASGGRFTTPGFDVISN